MKTHKNGKDNKLNFMTEAFRLQTQNNTSYVRETSSRVSRKLTVSCAEFMCCDALAMSEKDGQHLIKGQPRERESEEKGFEELM